MKEDYPLFPLISAMMGAWLATQPHLWSMPLHVFEMIMIVGIWFFSYRYVVILYSAREWKKAAAISVITLLTLMSFYAELRYVLKADLPGIPVVLLGLPLLIHVWRWLCDKASAVQRFSVKKRTNVGRQL